MTTEDAAARGGGDRPLYEEEGVMTRLHLQPRSGCGVSMPVSDGVDAGAADATAGCRRMAMSIEAAAARR